MKKIISNQFLFSLLNDDINIINIYDDNDKYINYIFYEDENKIYSFNIVLRFFYEGFNSMIIFYIKGELETNIFLEVKDTISDIQQKYKSNLAIYLLEEDLKTSKLCKQLGFKLLLRMRDHILIDNTFYNVTCFIKHRRE